ncbi:MAG: hypothetical protein ACREEM_35665 [Blastocatellia bacterium]
MTESMFCQFCGMQLRRTARYCKGCGGRVDEHQEDEPVAPRMTVPLRTEEHGPRPWRQNEDALILPITLELPREPVEEFEMDSESEVVPISHASIPTLVESPVPLEIPRQTVTSRVEPGSEPVKQPVRTATSVRRKKQIALGIPLLMLAVILLFVLAYLSTK